MKSEDGMHLMPESYAVPADAVNAEYSNPGSQPREVVGRCPFLWGQSLFILGKLLQEVFYEMNINQELESIINVNHFDRLHLQGFLAVGELDPLNRRLGAQKKPDVVVQVVSLKYVHIDNELPYNLPLLYRLFWLKITKYVTNLLNMTCTSKRLLKLLQSK